MSEREPRFRYRLEPLAKLRAAERDALVVEAARAAREVERRSSEHERIGRRVERAEWALRTLNRGGAEIRVDEQLRLRGYLRLQRDERERAGHELAGALREQNRVLAALQDKQRDAKALETHRERKLRRFDEERARASAKAADERWLQRRERRGG